mgnify:CR=1 FL=1
MNGMNKTEGMTVEEVMRRDKRFRYMLLARLQSDCEYYLGFGNRSTGPVSYTHLTLPTT